jgi:DNA-binding response OmpR family regulator
MPVEPSKVMVIDDVAPARHVLIGCLRVSGFAAEHGESSEDAVDAIRKREFDLALLDIENLSGISAPELCHQIRAPGKPIGILLTTGAHVEKEIAKALEAGADDYITKPFRTADLISRCDVVLHRVRANNELEENSVTVQDQGTVLTHSKGSACSMTGRCLVRTCRSAKTIAHPRLGQKILRLRRRRFNLLTQQADVGADVL